MIKHFCDRCGELIEGEKLRIALPVFSPTYNKSGNFKCYGSCFDWQNFDFCRKCALEMYKMTMRSHDEQNIITF